MFESVVTKLVKAVGSDSYLPSPSVTSAEELSPLSLVERKASRWYFGRSSYYTTEFKLTDVLQPSDTPFQVDVEPEKDMCGFMKNAEVKVSGKMAAHFKALFDAELENVDSITIKADLGDLHLVEVNQQALLNGVKGRHLNISHELVREMAAKDRRALCVVVSVIKTTKQTQIVASLNVKLDSDVKVDAKVADGEVSGGLDEDKSRTLTLPAGTVLAYEVRELSVNKSGGFRVMISHGSTGGFNASAIDETDAKPASDMLVKREDLATLYAGFSAMSDGDRKSVLLGVRQLCRDKRLVEELALRLRAGRSAQQSDDVTRIMDAVDKQTDREAATSALLSLCRALRNLDPVLLGNLSELTQSQVKVVSSILSECRDGCRLSADNPLVAQLRREDNSCVSFILEDMNFDLGQEGLSCSKGNSILTSSANMAFYAFNMIG